MPIKCSLFNLLKNKFVGFRSAQPNLHNLLIYKLIFNQRIGRTLLLCYDSRLNPLYFFCKGDKNPTIISSLATPLAMSSSAI